jgi:hypothetical protein
VAVATIDRMIEAAEERTRTLDSALRIAARPAAALDGKHSTNDSNTFFLRSALKRWEDGKAAHRATVDRAMAQLREAEREWNKRAGERGRAYNWRRNYYDQYGYSGQVTP